MTSKKILPSKGKILIAEPFMKDPYFKRSVVILADHNEQGSFGFMLNKTIELKIADAVTGFPEYKGELYLGGPVASDQLFYIHTLGEGLPKSIEITKGLWWGGDFKKLTTLIKNGSVKQDAIRFFIGYAGWDPEQLKSEMKEKSWIVAEPKLDVIMNPNTTGLWPKVLKSLGSDYAMMANYPVDPQLN
ncbi:MAG: YqgE/AlgH family protein [Bacteroidia bacterium]|nr:YqgE/AlgH family protein [Bacteroidia bacterium]